MSDQCSTFVRLWLYRHEPPKPLQADNVYNNAEFRNLCDEWNIHLQLVAPNHQEANGIIEPANRTLRMTSNRLLAVDRRTRLDDTIVEATYGKNLMRRPRLTPLLSYSMVLNLVFRKKSAPYCCRSSRSPRSYRTKPLIVSTWCYTNSLVTSPRTIYCHSSPPTFGETKEDGLDPLKSLVRKNTRSSSHITVIKSLVI